MAGRTDEYRGIIDMTDTKPKPYCFVLMPFSQEFDDIYNIGIQVCCSRAGAYCERVDEQIFQGTILERIYNQIAKADFIVADMTGRNPNVFYEVGYAHALNKPTILLTQNATDIPFDLKHFPHIVYEKRITALIEQLTRRIRWFVENPSAGGHSIQIEIELYLDNNNLSTTEIVRIVDIDNDCFLQIRVENASGKTLRPDDYGIGVIVPKNYIVRGDIFKTSRVVYTENTKTYMLSEMPTLFPECAASIDCEFELPKFGGRDTIIFRVFTSAGKRDYALVIERPTQQIARQRLRARAVTGSLLERGKALSELVTGWPDNDTRELLRGCAEEADGPSIAMRLLATTWPDNDTREFLKACAKNAAALERLDIIRILYEVFGDEVYGDSEVRYLLDNISKRLI